MLFNQKNKNIEVQTISNCIDKYIKIIKYVPNKYNLNFSLKFNLN